MTHRDHLRRAAILVAALIAIVAIVSSDAANAALHELLEKVRVIIVRYPNTGMLVFVLLAALSGLLVFFSSAIVIPVAVYTWGRTLTAVLLFVGWLLGGIGSYLLGRYFRRFVAKKKLQRYEKAVSASTPFYLVLLFQIALQSEIPGYVLGAARYDFRKYLGALVIAEVVFVIAAIYLSESFIGRKYPMLIGLSVAAILVSVVAFRIFHSRLKIAGK
jgi:uncharacterized membrane protein YdjX (TVP38/TMEM64 family)